MKSIVAPLFDRHRGDAGPSTLFADGVKECLSQFLQRQKNVSSGEIIADAVSIPFVGAVHSDDRLVVAAAVAEEIPVSSPADDYSNRSIDISSKGVLQNNQETVENIKVCTIVSVAHYSDNRLQIMYECATKFGEGVKKLLRIDVVKGVAAATQNYNALKSVLLEKMSINEDGNNSSKFYDLNIEFFDADMDSYIVLEVDQWRDFIDQSKKMLRLCVIEVDGPLKSEKDCLSQSDVQVCNTEWLGDTKEHIFQSVDQEGQRGTEICNKIVVPDKSDNIESYDLGHQPDVRAADDVNTSEFDVDITKLPIEMSDYLGIRLDESWRPTQGLSPPVGSELVAVNGVRVTGMKTQLICALLAQRCRPLLLQFRRKVKIPAGSFVADALLHKNAIENDSESDEDGMKLSTRSSTVGITDESLQLLSVANMAPVTILTVQQQHAAREKDNFKFSTFEAKYNHPLAGKLRKRVDEIIDSYNSCDWKEVTMTGLGTPEATMISLYRYIESELQKLGLLDPSQPQGGGVPIMDDTQVNHLRGHIERFMMSRVLEKTISVGPLGSGYATYHDLVTLQRSTASTLLTQNSGVPQNASKSKGSKEISPARAPEEDSVLQFQFNSLAERMAFLRFLSLGDLGLGSDAKSDYISHVLSSSSSHTSITKFTSVRLAEEWYIAMRELCRACIGPNQTPNEIVHRIQNAISLAIVSAERYVRIGSSKRPQVLDVPVIFLQVYGETRSQISNRFRVYPVGEQLATEIPDLGADEILPVVAWLLIQANPPRIEKILWLCSEFRHPDLAHGITNYSLAQLSSAIEFVKTAGPKELLCGVRETEEADPSVVLQRQIDALAKEKNRYEATLRLIVASKRGDFEAIKRLIEVEEADINGYTPDQRDTPLSAAVRYGQLESVLALCRLGSIVDNTSTKALDVNLPLSPCYAGPPPYCSTALHIAVGVGNLEAVIMLLQSGADRYATDSEGKSPLDISIASKHDDISKVLIADPALYRLVPAILAGEIAIVEGLLMQRVDACSIDVDINLTPLMAAVHIRSEHIVGMLIGHYYSVTDTASNKSRYLKVYDRFDLDETDKDGFTALMWCARSTLLATGSAKSNVKTDSLMRESTGAMDCFYDSGPISESDECADDVSRMRIAVRLLSAGSKRDAVDVEGKTALLLALCGVLYEDSLENDIPVANDLISQVNSRNASSQLPIRGSTRLALSGIHVVPGLLSLPNQIEPVGQMKLKQESVYVKYSESKLKIINSARELQSNFAGTVNWIRFPRLAAVLYYNPFVFKIYICARDNSAEGVQALIDQRVDPNIMCPVEYYTALMAAVYNRNDKIVDILLQDSRTNLDLKRFISQNMTALHYAAAAGSTTIIGKLLFAGADRYAATTNGKVPFDFALENGHTDSADVLKYDPEKVSICLAAKHGDERVTRALLAQGVSLNTRRRHSTNSKPRNELFAPIIAASAYGRFDYIKFLFQESDNNAKIPYPINFNLNRETIEVDIANPEGHTALMCAAMVGHENIVVYLLVHGRANRYLTDSGFQTAADWAKRKGHDSVYNILVFDPDRCFIHDYVAGGNVDASIALFKQNVDPNTRYHRRQADFSNQIDNPWGILDGETPLSVAARLGKMAILKLLLRAPDIQVDARDIDGVTPLGRAAQAGMEESVLLLLKHGAARYSFSHMGRKRPVDLALENGRIEIAALLEADPEKVNCHDLCANGRVWLF